MTLKTTPWDATDTLTSKAEIAAYLQAALAENDAAFYRKALDTAERARSRCTRNGSASAKTSRDSCETNKTDK